MTNNKKTNNINQSWNSQDLIGLSQNLGEAYLTGLDNSKSGNKADSLTANKLIEMNKDRENQSN